MSDTIQGSKFEQATVGDVRRLLERLGFTRQEIPNATHVLFIHPDGLQIPLAGADADELPAILIAAIRGNLTSFGIIDAEEFDGEFKRASAG